MELSQVSDAYKASLPADSRRNTTTRETSLEYRRAVKLSTNGHRVAVKCGSLLAAYADIAGDHGLPTFPHVDVLPEALVQAYVSRFTVSLPYNWTSAAADVNDLANVHPSTP